MFPKAAQDGKIVAEPGTRRDGVGPVAAVRLRRIVGQLAVVVSDQESYGEVKGIQVFGVRLLAGLPVPVPVRAPSHAPPHSLRATARLAVEKFDDVSFEKSGFPQELVQTKHHSTPGNLTDTSEDWWKTLKIWSEGVRDKDFLLPGVSFSLVTTQTAPAGSCRSSAGGKSRDPEKAEAVLLAAAGSSTNQQLVAAFDVFKKLAKAKRSAMLSAVWVFDAACSIGTLSPSSSISRRCPEEKVTQLGLLPLPATAYLPVHFSL